MNKNMSSSDINQKESSLTAPSDRDDTTVWKPDVGVPPLTNEETEKAVNELISNDIISAFPRVERSYADPPIPLQNISLVSFIPAKGVEPNKDGVYGIAKVRGSFATETEANSHAEKIIRETDSFNVIHHAYTGRPFPITDKTDFTCEQVKVDLQRNTTETISHNIRQQRKEKQQVARELKERQEKLLEESKRDRSEGLTDEEKLDEYITLNVKNANLKFTFCEALKKMAEVRDRIIQTTETIREADEEEPTFKDCYYEKFANVRREAGYNDNESDVQKTFLKFMVEHVVVPTIDTQEVLPVFDGTLQ